MKTFFYFILGTLLFSSCKSASPINTIASRKTEELNRKLVEKIVISAEENLGAPYKKAGITKTGYDCSGLVFSSFALHNVSIPRTSIAQSQTGINLGRYIEKAQRGDLVFFKTNNSSQINHVGIVTVVKDGELQFIHTSTSKGVIISSTKEAYYQKTFVQVNHLIR